MPLWDDLTHEQKIEVLKQGNRDRMSLRMVATLFRATANQVIGFRWRHRETIGKWHQEPFTYCYSPPVQRRRKAKAKPKPPTPKKPITPPRESLAAKQALTTSEPDMLEVPFLDRRPNQCAWPLWEDGDSHRNCCGNPVDPGARQPYCAHHRSVSGSPVPAAKRKAA